ncbi:hypothetical protein D3C81_753180 [compost metagenome]
MNVMFHLPARFVGTVAHSFCRCGYGAMKHREAPAEHSEHLHLVNFALPYVWFANASRFSAVTGRLAFRLCPSDNVS